MLKTKKNEETFLSIVAVWSSKKCKRMSWWWGCHFGLPCGHTSVSIIIKSNLEPPIQHWSLLGVRMTCFFSDRLDSLFSILKVSSLKDSPWEFPRRAAASINTYLRRISHINRCARLDGFVLQPSSHPRNKNGHPARPCNWSSWLEDNCGFSHKKGPRTIGNYKVRCPLLGEVGW